MKNMPLFLILLLLFAGCNQARYTSKPTIEDSYMTAKKEVLRMLKEAPGTDITRFVDTKLTRAEYPDSSYSFKGTVSTIGNSGNYETLGYSVVIKWMGGDWTNDRNWKVKSSVIDSVKNE